MYKRQGRRVTQKLMMSAVVGDLHREDTNRLQEAVASRVRIPAKKVIRTISPTFMGAIPQAAKAV